MAYGPQPLSMGAIDTTYWVCRALVPNLLVRISTSTSTRVHAWETNARAHGVILCYEVQCAGTREALCLAPAVHSCIMLYCNF